MEKLSNQLCLQYSVTTMYWNALAATTTSEVESCYRNNRPMYPLMWLSTNAHVWVMINRLTRWGTGHLYHNHWKCDIIMSLRSTSFCHFLRIAYQDLLIDLLPLSAWQPLVPLAIHRTACKLSPSNSHTKEWLGDVPRRNLQFCIHFLHYLSKVSHKWFGSHLF